MKSFANELKSVKASADKANEVGKKVLGNHSASKDVETKIAKMKDLFESTEKLEKEKVEKLDKAVKFLEEMEAKSVELASKTDKLNSAFSTANSHLSEPINCNSSKEAEELEHEVDHIKKDHEGNSKKSLDEIENLEKGIKEKGGDPSQYSNISASGLKKKFDDISNKIKQKQDTLKKEIEKQKNNEKILADYNSVANGYSKWSETALKEIMADKSGTLEEQIKELKKLGEATIKKSSDDISKIEKYNTLVEEADISENVDKTYNDLQSINELIGDSVQKKDVLILKKLF